MAAFDRRLPSRGLEALGALASAHQGNWWKDLLSLWAPSGHEGDLRLAIRNGYLNFYSCGQSIARISFDDSGRPALDVHWKYAAPKLKFVRDYVRLTDRWQATPSGVEPPPYEGIDTLKTWIGNARGKWTPEKTLVEKVVAANAEVVDLEMGLPASPDRKTALRMDLVALERGNVGQRIVFWEAKTIDDGRIRSSTEDVAVFRQMLAYRSFLSDEANRNRVASAYASNSRLLVHLHQMACSIAPTPELGDDVLKAAEADAMLEVDVEPRLIVFGRGPLAPRSQLAWDGHARKLRNGGVPFTLLEDGSYALRRSDDGIEGAAEK